MYLAVSLHFPLLIQLMRLREDSAVCMALSFGRLAFCDILSARRKHVSQKLFMVYCVCVGEEEEGSEGNDLRNGRLLILSISYELNAPGLIIFLSNN